jgi:2-polyprenyl-3-methyl-5-hydroxy-6-metoxy-1,4-benzoquinol methylase
MPLLISLVWRVVMVLGILAMLTEAATNQSNGSQYKARTLSLNVSAHLQNSDQIITMPLKRVDHSGVTTPSIAKRFFKTDVLGVFGAAYLAECTSLFPVAF